MKVVINDCFGGFSLSKSAVLWLADRGHPGAVKEKAEMEAKAEKWRGVPEKTGGLDYFEQSQAHSWDQDVEMKGRLFRYSWHPRDEDQLPRHDQLLIECVEALGGQHREGASGPCASLKIVEIPDGVEYVIEEYDGNEHIAEKHRTWG